MKPNSDKSKGNKLVNKKGLTTFLLFLSALIVSVSGIVLYLSPNKHAPMWVKALFCGLEKDQWKDVHTVISVLFIIVALVHLFLNWRIFRSYIKSRIKTGLNLKWELIVACLIVAVMIAGTIMKLPPFYTVIETRKIVKEHFKKYERQHKAEMRRLRRARGRSYNNYDTD